MCELEYTFALAMISNNDTQPQLWEANKGNITMGYSGKRIVIVMETQNFWNHSTHPHAHIKHTRCGE